MTATRRAVLATATAGAAWSVPQIAYGAPVPAAAASCNAHVTLCRVTRCGGDLEVTVELRSVGPAVFAFAPSDTRWTVTPSTIPHRGGTHTVTLALARGKRAGDRLTLAWTVPGCPGGVLPIDARSAR